MTDNANHMFIDRSQYNKLGELLKGIPQLSIDLWIAETRQARLGLTEGRKTDEQPLPYEVAAAEVADKLHSVLTGWAKVVCEQRATPYMPLGFTHEPEFIGPLRLVERRLPEGYIESTPGVALWLKRYRMALAMTEGAQTAYEEIRDVVQDAEWIVCPPIKPIVVDAEKVARARLQKLNAAAIAKLATQLGEEYRNLTERRVRNLRDAGKVRTSPSLSKSWREYSKLTPPTLYIVGQVLDAHLQHPVRRRDTKQVEGSSA